MTPLPSPVSLLAERAVRFLRDREGSVDSVQLADRLLALRAPSEPAARQLLETAFAGDPRLVYAKGGWLLVAGPAAAPPSSVDAAEPERVLVLLEGARAGRRRPFVLRGIAVLRLAGDEVIAACGGDIGSGPSSAALRQTVIEMLEGAAVVVHDPPGSLPAFERWIGEPVAAPISLRRLAQARLGLPAHHDLERLAERLGLAWRGGEDPLDDADALDHCFKALRRPGESLADLRRCSAGETRPIDWSRFAFDRQALRSVPEVPGTYRFFAADGKLLYVGKARNLRRRIGSYFREGLTRSPRIQELLDRLHRFEYEHAGSELEAMLREAQQIRTRDPEKNVQRQFDLREGRGARLRSILILEPAEPPAALRAYLIHRGRLVARTPIGPRGGGLGLIERALDDHFFFARQGPTTVPGPDLDVEVVVRWLSRNRDRAVAFDPTHLKSAREVTDRLRWFVGQGSPFEPDGTPILPR